MRSRLDDSQLVRPRPPQSQLPEDFDGAEGLVDGGISELFDRLEVNEVGLNLLEGEEIGSAVEVFAELADTSQVGLLGARQESGEGEVLPEVQERGVDDLNSRRFFYS